MATGPVGAAGVIVPCHVEAELNLDVVSVTTLSLCQRAKTA